MSEPMERCMVCAKPAKNLKGGICEICQDKIRREALGEQARDTDRAEEELRRHGIPPVKKQ